MPRSGAAERQSPLAEDGLRPVGSVQQGRRNEIPGVSEEEIRRFRFDRRPQSHPASMVRRSAPISTSLLQLLLPACSLLLVFAAARCGVEAGPVGYGETVGSGGGTGSSPNEISAEVADLLRRDPEFVVGMLRKLRTLKPVENTKRGIDFGLGRGYSGNQAAKHFMGLVASQYAGGPGKRKRSGQQVYGDARELIQHAY